MTGAGPGKKGGAVGPENRFFHGIGAIPKKFDREIASDPPSRHTIAYGLKNGFVGRQGLVGLTTREQ